MSKDLSLNDKLQHLENQLSYQTGYTDGIKWCVEQIVLGRSEEDLLI